jgi:hypothetical protein
MVMIMTTNKDDDDNKQHGGIYLKVTGIIQK